MIRPLNNSMRYTRTQDIEHACRCYRNAYVARLERQSVKATAIDKEWGKLCDIMFSILVQEGLVVAEEEDEVDELD